MSQEKTTPKEEQSEIKLPEPQTCYIVDERALCTSKIEAFGKSSVAFLSSTHAFHERPSVRIFTDAELSELLKRVIGEAFEAGQNDVAAKMANVLGNPASEDVDVPDQFTFTAELLNRMGLETRANS